MILVLALRRPLRRAFDSGATYLLWVLVPLATVAVLLPGVLVPVASIPAALTRALIVPASDAIIALQAQLHGAAMANPVAAVLGMWGVGAVIAVLLFARRQHRFERALGRLDALDDGTCVAQACVGLPAVVGILRPRIVLPVDHATRFDATQRLLVREHESVHIARGDQLVNLLALALRCLFWFNPLVHWAAPRFRHDQELACDARVVARHPHARRQYGEALLGTQALLQAAPLTCQIGFGHPLRERIAMLKRPLVSRPRRIAGFASALALVAGLSCAANVAKRDLMVADMFAPMRDASVADALALAKGMHGMVWVTIHITADGTVDEARIKSSYPPGVFDANAIALARKLRYQPTIRDGKPVDTWTMQPIRFGPRDDQAPPAGAGSHDARPRVLFVPSLRDYYPAEALAQKLTGMVYVKIHVSAAGDVDLAQIDRSEPPGVFDAKALEMARQIRFAPATRQGRPVASTLVLPMKFALADEGPGK